MDIAHLSVTGFFNFLDSFSISSAVAGAAARPVIKIGGKFLTVLGHGASILTFLKEYPRVSRFLYLLLVTMTCVGILISTTGCSSQTSLTKNSSGDVSGGPYRVVCTKLNDTKLVAWRKYANCSGKISFMQKFDTEKCSDEYHSWQVASELYRECLENEKQSSFLLNPVQGSSNIGKQL
jgi:hypothetical protein